jgi:hypothetical protein
MFPLSAVLFPHATMPLHVFEPRYRAMMHDCLEGDRRFGVVLIERGSEVGGGDQRAALGTRGVITGAAELPDGRWVLEVRGEAVIRIVEWLPDDPYPQAQVEEAVQARTVADVAAALTGVTQRVRRIRALLAEHGGGPALPAEARLDGGGDPEAASWQLCAAAPIDAYDAQRLLVEEDTTARLARLVELMDDLELDLQRMFRPE